MLALSVVGLLAAPTGQLALASASATYAEQQGHHGANTFTNYHNASGMGPRVDPAAWVQVSCKVYDPYIGTVNPDGYWYRLAGSPWNDQYYAAANTFMNGDPWNGPYTHNTDFNVPDCGAPQPPPPPPSPNPTVSLAQGPAAPHGYWYVISLDHFSAGSAVSVSCHDSVDPGGFRTFALTTNGSGHTATQSGCYSGDGPDHWVIANGFQSNHVSWSSAPAPPEQPTAGGGNTNPPSPPSGGGANGQPGTSTVLEHCNSYSGDRISASGSVAYSLYDHYMWGNGRPVVIDWAYFANDSRFTTAAHKLAIGLATQYQPLPTTDMYYALGRFTVKRTSTHCYAIYDHYDFTPNKPSNWLLFPFWFYQISGARSFDSHASGKL